MKFQYSLKLLQASYELLFADHGVKQSYPCIDKLNSENMAVDEQASDNLSSHQSASDKLGTDKLVSDKLASDKQVIDKLASEKLASDTPAPHTANIMKAVTSSQDRHSCSIT